MKCSLWIGIILTLALLCTGFVFAQKPAKNVNPRSTPALLRPRNYPRRPMTRSLPPRRPTSGTWVGHAQKAKDLLEQVNQD